MKKTDKLYELTLDCSKIRKTSIFSSTSPTSNEVVSMVEMDSTAENHWQSHVIQSKPKANEKLIYKYHKKSYKQLLSDENLGVGYIQEIGFLNGAESSSPILMSSNNSPSLTSSTDYSSLIRSPILMSPISPAISPSSMSLTSSPSSTSFKR